jgi:hypothetical protein
LAGASDADSDSLAVTAADTTTPGATVLLEADDVKYTPPTGYTGPESYTYTINDGNGGTAIGTVAVTVTANSGESPNFVSPPAYDSGSRTFRVTFAGIPNYTVEIAPDPNGAWSFLKTATAGANGLFEVTDAQLPPPPTRYYRTTYP